MQVRKFFQSSDVMRALKMELFGWKNFECAHMHDVTWWENRFFSWKICKPVFAQTPGIANLLFQIMLVAGYFISLWAMNMN